MERYSEHFTVDELKDPITGEIKLAKGFIDRLEALREDYGNPLKVTSGCRSSEHNDWLLARGYKASPNSLHLIENERWNTGGCCAVDVGRPNGVLLHSLVLLAAAHSWTMGIASTFVHLDRRVDYTELDPVVYTY